MRELLPHIATLETPDGIIHIKDKGTYDLARLLLQELGKKFYSKETKKNLRKLEKLIKKEKKAFKELTQPRKRGRPKGSKNKPKKTKQSREPYESKTLTKTPSTKNHIIVKEQFETTEEFRKRQREEQEQNA